MKYTVVTESSHEDLINKIQDVKDKASEIKRKRNLSTQKYYSKNKGKKTPMETNICKEQQILLITLRENNQIN